MRIKYICLFIAFFSAGNLFGQEKEEIVTYEIDRLLRDFEKAVSFTKDQKNISKDRVAEIAILTRSNDIYMLHDLDKRAKEMRKISVAEYVRYMENYYVGGLDVDLEFDPTAYKDAERIGDLYMVHINVTKKMMGLHKNQGFLNKSYEAVYTISYRKRNGALFDFKIGSILEKGIHERELSIRRTLGLHVGVEVSPRFALISMARMDKNKNWSASRTLDFGYGINASFYLNHFLAVTAGVRFAGYSTLYKFSGNDIALTDSIVDIDGNKAQKFVGGKLNEVSQINFLELPVGVQVLIARPRGIGVYVKVGGIYSRIESANSVINGTSIHSGSYDGIVIKGLELYEKGIENPDQYWFYRNFNTREYSDIHKTWGIIGEKLSVFGEVGAVIPISTKYTLFLGANYTHGITTNSYGFIESELNDDIDINKDTMLKHRTDFAITSNQKIVETNINSIGVNISFTYKF